MGNTPINTANIPAVLKALPNWVLWRYDERVNQDGTRGITKMPLQADLHSAKSNDPTTWTTFDAAWAACQRFPFITGVGFCLPLDGSIVGGDCDHVIEGDTIAPWAQTIVDQLDTYIEKSPSGTGLRFICYAHREGGKKKTITPGTSLEIYGKGSARFLTFTGNVIKNAGVTDQADKLDEILKGLQYDEPKKPKAKVTAAKAPEVAASDKYARCIKALNKTPVADKNDGSKRLITYAGKCVFFDLSDAEAIAAIRSMPAFPRDWSDSDILTRLRDAEKNGSRGAAYSHEYVRGDGDPDDLMDWSQYGSTQDAAQAIAEVQHHMFQHPDFQRFFDESPEIIQTLTKLIRSTSAIMSPMFAYWTAWSMLSVLVGKNVKAYNGNLLLYLNFWIALLADSGKGKSEINRFKELLNDLLDEGGAAPIHFNLLPANFTMAYLFNELGGGSLPSVKLKDMDDATKQMEKHKYREKSRKRKASYVIVDELALTFMSIINSGQSGASQKGNVLQLNDSGATIDGSTSTDGFRQIVDCCFSILGVTTPPRWVNDFCNEQNKQDGLPQRFLAVVPNAFNFTLEPLKISTTDAIIEIKSILRGFIQRVNQIGPVEAHLFSNEYADWIRETFTEVQKNALLAEFTKSGLVDLEQVDGKLIAQALKLMCLDRYCQIEVPKVDDSPWTTNISPPSSETTVIDLKDAAAFKRYLFIVAYLYCKQDTSKIMNPEMRQVCKKILAKVAAKPISHNQLLVEMRDRKIISRSADLIPYLDVLITDKFIAVSGTTSRPIYHFCGKNL